MHRIQEAVVVSLEGVVTAVDRDYAVQHDLVEKRAVIRDDVSHLILVGGTDEGQVAALEPWLHADAVGHDIGGESPDLSRGKVEARQAHQDEEDGVDNGYTRSRFASRGLFIRLSAEMRLEGARRQTAALLRTIEPVGSSCYVTAAWRLVAAVVVSDSSQVTVVLPVPLS